MTTAVQSAPSKPAAGTAVCAIRTVLTHVLADADGLRQLDAATALARLLGATLYGLGAEGLPPMATADPTGLVQGEIFLQMEDQITRDIEAAKTAFEAATGQLDTVWASIDDTPTDVLTRAARSADLIFMTRPRTDQKAPYRFADPAQVMLRSGRPVLIAPPHAEPLAGTAVVVAWKDTREARRALADALPFLQRAATVVVLEVCANDEAADAGGRTDDVCEGLRRHGVEATGRVIVAPRERIADELDGAARAIGADLIVAGGYGHSRFGEWMFGGVTNELLSRARSYVLLSH
jgi:nucleotide-binding universal stress UspA family protein